MAEDATGSAVVRRSGRRSNVDRSATPRKQVLDAVIGTLQTEGYGAVTMQKIAAAAGVSTGAVMHHFPSRPALFVAVVEYAYEKQLQYRLAEISKVEPGLPRYRSLIDLAWKSSQTAEWIACDEIRAGSRSDPEVAEAVTPLMSQVSNDYGRLVGEIAREAGLTPDYDLRALTATTAMAVRSLVVSRLTYPSAQVVDYVLSTLKKVREDIIAAQLGEQAREDHRAAETPSKRGARKKTRE